MPVKTAFYNMMKGTGGFPVSLIISKKKFVLLIDSNPRGGTHTRGKRHKFSFRSNFKTPTSIFCGPTHLSFSILKSLCPNPGNIPLLTPRPTWPGKRGVKSTIKITLTIAHQAKGIFMIIIGYPPLCINCFVTISPTILIGVN